MRSCPHCSSAMKQTTFDGRQTDAATGKPTRVTMDECARGCGFWFDAFEAEATIGLEETLESLAEPTDRVSGADCPACHEDLIGVGVGKVQLDLCPACGGFWFDAGELKRVSAELAARGQSLADRTDNLVCTSCGRGGLTQPEVFMGEDGLRCHRCMVVEEQLLADAVRQEEQNAMRRSGWHRGGTLDGFGGLILDVLARNRRMEEIAEGDD